MADRRRLTANLAAVGLLLALGAGVVAWQRPWHAADPAQQQDIPADSRALLVQQFQRMTTADSRADFVGSVGTSDDARAMAAHIWDAQRALKVRDVRYAYRRGGDAIDRADGTTSAQTEVSWRGGSSDVRFRLRPRTDGFDVVGASAAGGDPLPVWLAGAIKVVRADGVTIISIDGGSRDVDVAKLAGTAANRVERLVPTAEGRLTVVTPQREATAAAVVGRRPAQVAQVAAISANLGGANGEPAIIVNPTLFSDMDQRARQIVMTHEAVHVLTGIVGREVDLWVAEGFADYVALRDDRAPLRVSAGQILRQVKADGAPKKLPSATDFDESAHGLGAVYESAWLAFRMLGERHGDAAVRDFYAAVVAGTPVDDAAQSSFGMSVGEITTAWRAYLTKSASTVS